MRTINAITAVFVLFFLSVNVTFRIYKLVRYQHHTIGSLDN